MSKAELARLISAKPEIVRRVLTAKSPKPTPSTVRKIAAALGYSVQLVATKPKHRKQPTSIGARRMFPALAEREPVR